MNQNENDITTFSIVKNGIIQLIKESRNQYNKFEKMRNDLKNVDSDKSERIDKLIQDYRDNLGAENEFFKDLSVHFDKLISIYEARMDIEKSIQEESNELLDQI